MMGKNLVDHGYEVPELSVLVKDHKDWTYECGKVVPTRPVLSGNNCINIHLSEIISEIVEPLIINEQGSEVQSTEEFLSRIDDLNTDVLNGRDNTSWNVLDKFSSYWSRSVLNDNGHNQLQTHESNTNVSVSGVYDSREDEVPTTTEQTVRQMTDNTEENDLGGVEEDRLLN